MKLAFQVSSLIVSDVGLHNESSLNPIRFDGLTIDGREFL